MKLAVVGSGYVGLVAGACLANLGNDVICVDKDEQKIERLKKGEIPIYEPGLSDLVELNIKEGRISFTTDLVEAIRSSDVIFLAVGTPPGKNHEADLSAVVAVSDVIGKTLKEDPGYKVIVNKSTVPVGTGDKVKEIISRHYDGEFDVVSNPEFLREGTAIRDFTAPDRIVVGLSSKKAEEKMVAIYKPIERTGRPILVTDIRSAEIIKYASNAFLATKISFINELSHLCEKTGADVTMVAKGMGLDTRIGPRFLHAGAGYGGSCFPKDVQALIQTGKENDVSFDIIRATEDVNMRQKLSVIPKVEKLTGGLDGKTIAIWGLAFKPNTDDMREAPSLSIIPELLKKGAKVKAHDPIAQDEAKKVLDGVEFCERSYDALEGADCLLILTEWDEYRLPDKDKMKSSLKSLNIVDARNIYDPAEIREAGFSYVSIGRP